MSFKRILSVSLVSLFLWGSGLILPVFASIHTYPEANQQVLYRSRLSAPDTQNQAWQLILFKRVQAGQVKEFQLRLVGFPGQVEISHPASLSIEDSHGHVWSISDMTQNELQIAPVQSSVGQYDMLPLMGELTQAQRLDLQIPLLDQSTRRVAVPQSMVREWLSLKDLQE